MVLKGLSRILLSLTTVYVGKSDVELRAIS